MIDDLQKTIALTEKMQLALPLMAIVTKEARRTMQKDANKDFPRKCNVTEIRYLGDEGGILCHLDFGFSGTKNVYIVSITHLRFDRKNSLTREIEVYCKHRTKRLKKLNRGMPST